VIVPCTVRGARLAACIAHVERQTYREFEVIVVPDAAAPELHARVRTIASGAVLPNRKRQLAAEATSAPILAFIDDDAYPDPNWLAAALPYFADSTIVAVGGPAVTAATDPPASRASGAVFASPLVTSGTRYRYVPAPQRDVDALPSCNLLIRREAFLRGVEATVDTWPGEDILTCIEATRDGSRIVYDPAVLVYHHRRALFAAHVRQVWRYGVFRGSFLRRFGRWPRNAAYAAPAAFALAHAAAAGALTQPRLRAPVVLAAGAYALLVARSALHEAHLARANPWLVGAGIYLTHITYGSASIVGFLSSMNDER
jgi:cellulose synthase/poly-beta-1,6-N-acetylglucosamine synthase-like glycosyltransferase